MVSDLIVVDIGQALYFYIPKILLVLTGCNGICPHCVWTSQGIGGKVRGHGIEEYPPAKCRVSTFYFPLYQLIKTNNAMQWTIYVHRY